MMSRLADIKRNLSAVQAWTTTGKVGGREIWLMTVLEGRGQIIESDEIRFDNVPLISPNGDVLVKAMSFNVEPGVGVCLT